MIEETAVQTFADLLDRSESVLIGAGAGLSSDAGFNYMDEESFAKNYPAMVKLGFKMKAQLMGLSRWSPELEWGYYAAHVNEVRFCNPPHEVYQKLFELIEPKGNYFVLTSNVDWLFVKNGFSKNRIFTPQGDYALMQCKTPCTQETWSSKPIIDAILPNMDPATQEITDSSLVPKCPNCGGPVFLNVRIDQGFVEEPYYEQSNRFQNWLQENNKTKMLVIDIGSGFNTPSVVRWPMERIVYQNENATLIRINLSHPEFSKEINDRSFSFEDSSINIIRSLWGLVFGTQH